MLRPLRDLVTVRLDPANTHARGILLPEVAQKQFVKIGTVLACGPGRQLPGGRLAPMDIKPGDRVLLPPYGDWEVEDDGEKVRIMPAEDVVGIIE